jgi:cyclin-dependent kinase 7
MTTATTSSANRYAKLETLGEGTFGVVYKASDSLNASSSPYVAIKKIRLGKAKEGINFTAIREIKLLRELHHPHVVPLVDVFSKKRNLHLVFEFASGGDLEMIIKDSSIDLSIADVKSYLKMSLEAIAFCHQNWILHRDVKPNNLLVHESGALKLADFGLARAFGSPERENGREYTRAVFARWYRAPELLLGAKRYGPKVDSWAVGMVFAELMLRKPFCPGSSDIDQLTKIYHVLGTPTEEEWEGCAALPDWMSFPRKEKMDLRKIFGVEVGGKSGPGGKLSSANAEAIDLLEQLLKYDPEKRISCQEALKHAYFNTAPAPTEISKLPKRKSTITEEKKISDDKTDGEDEAKRAADKRARTDDDLDETEEEKEGTKKRLRETHPTATDEAKEGLKARTKQMQSMFDDEAAAK